MSKLVSFVLNKPASSGELTAAQSAAQAAADAVISQSGNKNSVLSLPTEKIRESVPEAPVLQETFQPLGDPNAMERIEREAEQGRFLEGAAQENLLAPGVFAQATPEQAQDQYLDQLAHERTRPAEQIFDQTQGVITLPVNARKGVVSTMTEDISKMEEMLDVETGTAGGGKAPWYQAMQKLGMAESVTPGSPKLKAVRGAGGMAYLAVVGALASLEADKETQNNQKIHKEPGSGVSAEAAAGDVEGTSTADSALSRFVFAERIADAFEKLTTNPQNLDVATGEVKGVGGSSVLNQEEKRGLGAFIMEVMKKNDMLFEGDEADSGGSYIRERKAGTGAGKQYEYFATKKGMKLLHDLSPTMEKLIPELSRPVSLAPLRRGEYFGEKALVQQKITRVPIRRGRAGVEYTPDNPRPGSPSRIMNQAMDVMGTMPNIISGHKLAMTDMMLNDIRNKAEEGKQLAKQMLMENDQVDIDTLPPYKELKDAGDEAGLALRREAQTKLTMYRDMILGGMMPDPNRPGQLIRDENRTPLESPFAKLFGQDVATVLEIANASWLASRRKKDVMWDGTKWVYTKSGEVDPDTGEVIKAKTEVSPKFVDQIEKQITEKTANEKISVEIGYERRSPQQGGQAHRAFANEVVQSEMIKAEKTRDQAYGRSGYKRDDNGIWQKEGNPQVFYYGVTAIGNSSRLMITNTELNYQSNKLARFMVDNPRPSLFTKGGKKDKNFRYLTARALLDAADTFSPEALIDLFNSKETQDVITPIAQRVYRASQAGDPAALAAAIQEAQAAEGVIADEWEGNGEWGFQVDALHEWGKYADAADGAQLQTRMKAEVDGINNGSSIQGLQFGDRDILKRAGILWEEGNRAGEGDRESVIPEDNMRGFVFSKIMEDDGDGGLLGLRDVTAKSMRELGAGDVEAGEAAAKELLNWIARKGKKKFIKIPLMTTIYGKPHNMHGDHVRSFLTEKWGEIQQELNLPDKALRPVSTILTKVISNGLKAGLTSALLHQDVIKYSSGWMFNMMNVIPEIRGANGYVVQAGGVDYIPVLDEKGVEKTVPVTLYDMSGGVRASAKPKSQSRISLHKSVPSAAAKKKDGKVGNITRNQLAVNGTHNIDATVAQKTLIEAKRKKGDTFWGQQVFDAFIGDLDSLEDLLDISNRVFYEVNRDYSMLRAELDAYKDAQQLFKARVDEATKNEEVWDVAAKDSPYRSIEAFGKSFFGSDKFKNFDEALQVMMDFGFEVGEGGGVMFLSQHHKKTPMEVYKFVKYMEENFLGNLDVPVVDAFHYAIKKTEADIAEFREELEDRVKRGKIRQFN